MVSDKIGNGKSYSIPSQMPMNLDIGWLSKVLEGSPIPTFVIDRSHKVIYYNKALENLTGLKKEEVIGTSNQWKTFYRKPRPVLADLIVDGADFRTIKRYYKDKIRASSTVEGAYEAIDYFRSLKGEGRWLFFTAAPIKDESGNLVAAMETLQDITEQKRAEEALKISQLMYKALVDFFPYPVVLFNLDGTVKYLNPAFEEVFGWKLAELVGKKIPYVPPGYEKETQEKIRLLLDKKIIQRHETKRLTKDGRLLDVVMRGAILGESTDGTSGQLVTLRDITQEKRLQRNNEILLKISLALPEYPDLEDLLDFVGEQVKDIIGCEGALIILVDFDKQELYTLGAAYEDRATEKRVKEIRFKMNELVAGEVISTGEPKIVLDTSQNPELHRKRDEKLGYHTRNLLVVPMKSVDRTVGALCAINKKIGVFDETDLNILTMIANTVVLSIENARFADELKKAFIEVSRMNRIKDKVINHLSHELKTPVSVLMGSLKILEERLKQFPSNIWERTLQRAMRNTDRIVDLVDRIEDIIRGNREFTRMTLHEMLNVFADEIENLISQRCADDYGLDEIRKRIDEIYLQKEILPTKTDPSMVLTKMVPQLIEKIRERDLKLFVFVEQTGLIQLPEYVFQKIVMSLCRNAVENTPDGGEVAVYLKRKDGVCRFVVKDTGVGILPEYRDRIFEGFVTTRDTLSYSTKRPFDFNAGGKGMDLLRLKVFAERFGFKVSTESRRCEYLPRENDLCAGSIRECAHIKNPEECLKKSGTIFEVEFNLTP